MQLIFLLIVLILLVLYVKKFEIKNPPIPLTGAIDFIKNNQFLELLDSCIKNIYYKFKDGRVKFSYKLFLRCFNLKELINTGDYIDFLRSYRDFFFIIGLPFCIIMGGLVTPFASNRILPILVYSIPFAAYFLLIHFLLLLRSIFSKRALSSYFLAYKNSFNIKKKEKRYDFWSFMIPTWIIHYILVFYYFAAIGMDYSDIALILLLLYGFITFIPSISIQIRRLNDIKKPWALVFLNLIPFMGSAVLIIFYAQPTEK